MGIEQVAFIIAAILVGIFNAVASIVGNRKADVKITLTQEELNQRIDNAIEEYKREISQQLEAKLAEQAQEYNQKIAGLESQLHAANAVIVELRTQVQELAPFKALYETRDQAYKLLESDLDDLKKKLNTLSEAVESERNSAQKLQTANKRLVDEADTLRLKLLEFEQRESVWREVLGVFESKIKFTNEQSEEETNVGIPEQS